MRVYDAKNIKYRDGLAERRRRVFVLKMSFFIGLASAIFGLVLYLLFFSKLLDIRDISITGLDKASKEEFNAKLKSRLGAKWLGHIEHQKNIIFFNSDNFRAEVLANFPEIKNISVGKKPPHALNIDVTERETAGIWCFVDGSTNLTTSCKYFDKEGNVWGEAARSSGFLVLNIDDLRKDTQSTIERNLLESIMFISARLKEDNIFINKFTIPEDFFGDFNALTSYGYELLFSTDSNIKDQLEVLKIFLAEKQKESPPAGGFKPQYIDLRIKGRVYYQ